MSKENKRKEINKNGVSQVVIKSVKGQAVSDREVYAINNQEIEGLLPVEVIKKGNSFKLIYNLTGLMTLSDFLLTPMNRESFARLLQNILEVLKGMQKAYFNQHALNMNLDSVMINPAKQRLLFMYIPIQAYDGGSSLRAFLLGIIQAGSFVKEDDSDYVKEYIRILNEGINFSVFELEEYIKRLVSEDGYRTNKNMLCHKCGTQVRSGAKFCSVCGAKLSDVTENADNAKLYNPLVSAEPAQTVAKEEEGSSAGCSTATQGLYRQSEECGGTTLLGYTQPKYPYLIREKTEEKIVIDRNEFCIGKSRQNCNYSVTDNSAVSRQHAQIISRDGRCYIKDLNSTNKTYVNERAIEEEELTSGAKIRLGNERFIFYIE